MLCSRRPQEHRRLRRGTKRALSCPIGSARRRALLCEKIRTTRRGKRMSDVNNRTHRAMCQLKGPTPNVIPALEQLEVTKGIRNASAHTSSTSRLAYRSDHEKRTIAGVGWHSGNVRRKTLILTGSNPGAVRSFSRAPRRKLNIQLHILSRTALHVHSA